MGEWWHCDRLLLKRIKIILSEKPKCYLIQILILKKIHKFCLKFYLVQILISTYQAAPASLQVLALRLPHPHIPTHLFSTVVHHGVTPHASHAPVLLYAQGGFNILVDRYSSMCSLYSKHQLFDLNTSNGLKHYFDFAFGYHGKIQLSHIHEAKQMFPFYYFFKGPLFLSNR